MITKGTADYKRAQELANDIKRVAGYNEWRDNSLYNLWCDSFDSFIRKISETNTFGANIARTVLASIGANYCKRDRSMANVSDKQAWILATTAIELDIKFEI